MMHLEMTKPMWNDGPPMVDFMGVEGAPPIARKHLCSGGGGGSSAGQPPDYSQYISAMTQIGNKLTGYGSDLYDWAKKAGVDLTNLATTVSNRAGEVADWATGKGKEYISNWEKTYGPLYQAQAKNATDFAANLPTKMDEWAGSYGADVAQAFDASKEAATRKLQGYGLSSPSIGSAAIDAATSNQRAAAITAAAQQGRVAARGYSDQLTGTALQSGAILPQLSGQMTSTGMAAGNQQINAPESAISTTAGAYAPATNMYGTALPYMKSWGDTMANAYDQQLKQAQINSQSSSGWGALAGSVLSAGAQLGAAYMSGGTSLAATGAAGAAGQMAGRRYAAGGPVDPVMPSVVPPEQSPSGGAQVDDVVVPIQDENGAPTGTGAINVGEFVMPKRTVEWYGEKFMQNLVAKADKERQKETHAAPEMSAGAMDTSAPQMGGYA